MKREPHNLVELVLSHDESVAAVAISEFHLGYSDVLIIGNGARRRNGGSRSGWNGVLGALVVIEHQFHIWIFGRLLTVSGNAIDRNGINSCNRNPHVSWGTIALLPDVIANFVRKDTLSDVLVKIFASGVSHEGLVPVREPISIPGVNIFGEDETLIGGVCKIKALKQCIILNIEIDRGVAASAVSTVGAGLTDLDIFDEHVGNLLGALL